jgi:hypothetical protein
MIFLDQQKAFDWVEWGWVDHVLSKFNFGEKFSINFGKTTLALFYFVFLSIKYV